MTKTQTRVFIRRRKGIIIEQKRRFQSLRATRTAQSQVNISKCILRGAETGGIVFQPRFKVNLVDLYILEETSTIIDITSSLL